MAFALVISLWEFQVIGSLVADAKPLSDEDGPSTWAEAGLGIVVFLIFFVAVMYGLWSFCSWDKQRMDALEAERKSAQERGEDEGQV